MRHSREDSLAKDDLALDLIISVGLVNVGSCLATK